MIADDIVAFIEDELAGTVVVVASRANGAPEVAWGDVFFIFDPETRIPADRQFPYTTIVNSDYPGFDEPTDHSTAMVSIGSTCG